MTEIKLYNTRTRSKEVFTPIDAGNVRMYVCGPTVYDRAHIGNARPVVVFDVLYRLLRHVYGEDAVTYVRNFTDVDDRIIEKAVATKGADETLEAATRRITDETILWYHEDMDALGALRPDHEPRCTEYIAPMVAMTRELIDKGYAYAAEGHVLFSVEAYEKYGALSGRSVDDMIAGARVEVAPYKKNPMDFVIWKPSTDDQPGWDSPWGRGRPGWHIECSAMADALLTMDKAPEEKVFDIHAGGIDLQFPHHENELAQSCCVHGTERMANWWMHNEMLRVEGEKMSKSLGNFFTVRDLLDRGVEGEEIRYLLMRGNYRQTLDWTEARRLSARRDLEFLNIRLADFGRDYWNNPPCAQPSQDIVDALADDLDTYRATEILRSLAKRTRDTSLNYDERENARRTLHGSMSLLGFEPEKSKSLWRQIENNERNASILYTGERPAYESVIEGLILQRNDARKSRDFTRADAIRDGFAAAGVIVKDTPDGAVWELSPDFDPAKLEALR